MRSPDEPVVNPTWKEMVDSDPLISFSWYLSGRVACVLDLGHEVVDNLDAAFSGGVVNGTQFGRAEMLMWFWTLGAYEIVRTMCQARRCFRPELGRRLGSLKKELAQARMPAAKMEQPGRKKPATSKRSPAAWDLPNRDLLIGDPTKSMISARGLLRQFEEVVSSITPGRETITLTQASPATGFASMHSFEDAQGRSIRLSEERLEHLEESHPEMRGQLDRIRETLGQPERVVRSRTDRTVELFYRRYASTPVTSKYLCAVVKGAAETPFLVTAYFTDSIKRGDVLWEKT